MLPKEKSIKSIRAGAWKLFEYEDHGKFNLICLLENM